MTSIDPDGAVTVRQGDSEYSVGAEHILANVAPATLAALLGGAPAGTAQAAGPEGAQLKINMVLARLPALRDNAVSPEEAFTGTFHVNEGYAALERSLPAGGWRRQPRYASV